MIRVLIVASVRLYREGIAQVLGCRRGLTVVGTESDRWQTVADIQAVQPDVVLLDMTNAESHATIRDIKRLAPGVPIVALGVAELEGDVLACAEAGVAGYVTRDGSVDELVAVMESAARGELRCSPRIAGSLLRRLTALAVDREPSGSPARLTAREREIVRLMGRELSNKQIAGHLGIEVSTVKNHVHNLFEKLNVHRRADAARLVSQTRW